MQRRVGACLWIVACLTLLIAVPVWAGGKIDGRARVVDGDTIEVGGQRIRLYGIDAPEGAQLCEADGKQYRCGHEAASALSDKIGTGAVSCSERDRDRYGRIVAVCSLHGIDLNRWLVSRGHAVAYRRYSDDYGQAEAEAQTASRGVWRGSFDMPWDWRQGQRVAPPESASSTAPSETCQIKGNISRKGTKTYHVPGMRHYHDTRINTERGERWFCSETDARQAGWRRAPQ